jgi:uncharacterized protein
LSQLRDYTIEIFNLSNKEHQFQFEINDGYFALFPNDIVSKGRGKVDVSLLKDERMITAKFKIDVVVELTCDRSLDNFEYPISSEARMIFKFGEEDQELSDEIVMIQWETQRLNLAQLIFEFIGIEIPYKKLHPRFAKEANEDDDDKEGILIYSSQAEEKDDESKTSDDPRWAALQKLKEK